ncbi:MAG: hypothetical protein AAF206_05070 [Bacteroidota bacterium]
MEKSHALYAALLDEIPPEDTLYDYAIWYQVQTATLLEKQYRMAEEFDQALQYAQDGLKGIELGKAHLNEEFAKREFFMVKNIIVSYFGKGDFAEGKKWKHKLYEAAEKDLLPEGMDAYFNFDFFTLDGKNVWGYEWYEELPKNRYSKSFTKIVYYVYSTNPDGSDKDQLYRLHVLMFHGDNPHFDYVLTKRLVKAENEVSGTLYAYTYKEDIDYAQLQLDIKEVVRGNVNPDTRTKIPQKPTETHRRR